MNKHGLSAGLIAGQVGPVALYIGMIFALSSLSQSRFGAPASWMAIPNADKLAHLFEYAGLGALGLRALFLRGHGLELRRALPVMIALGGLCGLIDELYQATVPTRDASVGDLLADLCGVTIGATCARILLGRCGVLSRVGA